jgi:hypothetical protein
MYQNLLFAVKRRMMDEVADAFQDHPSYNEKVQVVHKFPYHERIQYGALLRQTSASQMRMSADNYMAEHHSHVRLARQDHYPSIAIEWARENLQHITELMEKEDVSAQLDPTLRMFRTSLQMLAGPGDTEYANNVGQIKLLVNGVAILPEFVDGKNRVVVMRQAPPPMAIVQVSYYFRKLAPPGIYMIDFIEDNEFVVAPIYTVDEELVIDSTTGTEITAKLSNNSIYPNSEYLRWLYRTSNVPIPLVKGVDYTINDAEGEITFLVPVSKGYQLLADYRWQPTNYINGPYTITSYQENHLVIPGVVLAVGKRLKKGDRQAIVVTQKREPQAKIYGGHWTMNLEFVMIAKDPIQMAEMGDLVVNWLWVRRKNVLEYEGITLNSVEPSGETEEVHMDATGDMYYETSISISIQTEWQEFRPYWFKIKDIIPDTKLFPGTQEYKVTVDEETRGVSLMTSLEADTRPVVQHPILGYERVI